MSLLESEPSETSEPTKVGPVLIPGETTDAVLKALLVLNPGAQVVDRGAYRRVLVAGCCLLTKAAVEAELGRPFRLPADLEAIMPSFKGRLALTEEEVQWRA